MWTQHIRNVTFCARLQVSSKIAENIQLLVVRASSAQLHNIEAEASTRIHKSPTLDLIFSQLNAV
jgi:hypothetical protein